MFGALLNPPTQTGTVVVLLANPNVVRLTSWQGKLISVLPALSFWIKTSCYTDTPFVLLELCSSVDSLLVVCSPLFSTCKSGFCISDFEVSVRWFSLMEMHFSLQMTDGRAKKEGGRVENSRGTAEKLRSYCWMVPYQLQNPSQLTQLTAPVFFLRIWASEKKTRFFRLCGYRKNKKK